MPIHHSYDNEKIRLRRVHWIGSGWDRIRTQGKILEEFMGAIPIYPQEGKKKAERWNVIISTNRICLLLCPWETGMPMQATPSPWCLVVALQLAEYTEGTRCDRAFSVVQGAGKGCTIRQDRLVGFKDHGFNQKCAIAEAIENLPMDDIIEWCIIQIALASRYLLLCPVSNHANYHRCQRKIQLYQHMALLNGRHGQLITTELV